jgi:hypothetical protein
MSNSPIHSGKASKVIGIALASATLSLGIVATAATASSAATPATTKALPAPKCTGCSAGPKGAVAVLSAAQTPSTPLTVRGLRPHTTSVLTPNWSGYVATGVKYQWVWGDWTVPTATCTAGENSASTTWVGLGLPTGLNIAVQMGTTSACVNGQAKYALWMNPAPAVPISYTVRPGTVVGAGVEVNSTSATASNYYLWMNVGPDSTTVASANLTVPGTTAPTSAEWITAWPVGSPKLTNFGTVNFQGAEAFTATNGGGAVSTLPNTEEVYLDNSAGVTTSSGLYGSGYDFSDYWIHPAATSRH